MTPEKEERVDEGNEWPDEIANEPKPEKKTLDERFSEYMDKVLEMMAPGGRLDPPGMIAMPMPVLTAPMHKQIRIFAKSSPAALETAVNDFLKGDDPAWVLHVGQIRWFGGQFILVIEYNVQGEITEAHRAEFEKQIKQLRSAAVLPEAAAIAEKSEAGSGEEGTDGQPDE